MKRSVDAGEILPEYDFSHGARNKFASRYATGSAVVVLEPDVAAAFPTSADAKRGVASAGRNYRETSPPQTRLAAQYLN